MEALVKEPRVRDTMWAVQATRTMNKGTRYESQQVLPTFYLSANAFGVTNRTHARAVAADILGAGLPGVHVWFEVHRVS